MIIGAVSKGLVLLLPATLLADQAIDLTDPNELVRRANLASFYAGADGRSDARMVIVDAQGREQMRQFTVIRRDRDDDDQSGGDQDFLVFFQRPSDVRGTVFLVNKHVDGDDDRWLYLPGLDLVKRVSAGDKRTSFVGSDYFYEDVSGRNPNDDIHELLEISDQYYLLRHVPKDLSGVEFVSYRTWIDKQTFIPMKIEYTSPQGDIYRRVEVVSVIDVEGKPTVARSQVSNLLSGGYTRMEFRYIDYDIGVPLAIFSERSLRNPPRQWLQRPL